MQRNFRASCKFPFSSSYLIFLLVSVNGSGRRQKFQFWYAGGFNIDSSFVMRRITRGSKVGRFALDARDGIDTSRRADTSLMNFLRVSLAGSITPRPLKSFKRCSTAFVNDYLSLPAERAAPQRSTLKKALRGQRKAPTKADLVQRVGHIFRD